VENSNNIDFKKKIEEKYSNVSCILSGENLGYGKANNLGLSKVRTKFALIINPDAKLDSKAIDNFFITVEKKINFALIGPYIQEEVIQNKNKNDKIGLTEVKNIKGFAMFLNLEQFKDIGFFDENFFIYYEEIDLCRRVIENKKKIYLDPTIKIIHSGGSSHNANIEYEMELSRNWHWMWSTFYYNKKYNGFFIALIKSILKLLSFSVKSFFYFILLNKIKSKIYFQRMSGLFNSIIGKKSWYRPKVF
jgi:GT2 family glycosyltransferase